MIGPGRTKLLFYTGRLFGAADALRMGLLDLVVPDDQLEAEAYRLAEEIAANAPLSIRNTKRVLRLLTQRKLDEAERREIAQLLEQTQGSADFQEGQRAVLEKRPPHFQGR